MSKTAVLLFALALSIPAALGAQGDGHASQHPPQETKSRSAFVEKVRQATEPFLDVRNTAGIYERILGCVSGPLEGAMGVHFVHGPSVMDGTLDAAHPEALIYEFKDSVARLVGVEFIVLAAVWHQTHAPDDPPVLEGQLLQFEDSPNRFGLPAFYQLHVWAWRDNPNGAFVDWNPRVSCEGQ